MAVALPRLPRYLVLEPVSTVRIEIELESPACEIDVELENPQPGRSFVLLIGHKEGPFVQRVRLAGRARILFDPETPGEYVLLLANPHREPLVLRLKGRNLPKGAFPPKGPATRPLLEVPKDAAESVTSAAEKPARRARGSRRTASGARRRSGSARRSPPAAAPSSTEKGRRS